MKILHKPGRWVVLAALSTMMYSLLTGNGGLLNIYSTHKATKHLEQQMVEVQRKIDSLKAYNHKFKTDTLFIERIAREKLGMARKDEVVFRFIEE